MKKNLLLTLILFLTFGFANAQNAWINEIHYDDANAAGDLAEGFEIVIENAGSYTLSDFRVDLYNGSTGNSYEFKTVDGLTVGATVGNFTFYYYASATSNYVQNGAPDGIALSYQGTLIAGQFLSYEGSFAGVGGVADGVPSTNIGVSETSSTTVGFSLQLYGTGSSYGDFQWNLPALATNGALNNSQTFGIASADPVITNITQTPASDVTTDDAVTITADITDDVAVGSANVLWGTSAGVYTGVVTMTNTTGATYEAIIPAYSTAGTIYYAIQATDGDPNTVLSSEMSYSVIALGPVITNIVQTPVANLVTPADAVSVSADVTDNVSVSTVVLKWGTTTGDYSGGTINMTLGTGDTYTTDTDIPAQVEGTAVFYVIEATDGDANVTTSNEQTYVSKSATQVATIAELRAGLTDGTIYEYTGEAIVTYEYTNGTYVKVWIEDATGAILVYDANGTVVTMDSYAIGDAITGMKGSLALYYGTLEFVPATAGTINSSNNAMPYQEVDALTLAANYATYAEELVTVTKASFDEADGTAVFASSTSYNLTDASGTVVFRTSYSGVDYLGTVIPTNKNVTALVAQYNGTVQITSRSLADFANPLYNVTFNVRMHKPIVDGTFVIGTDKVNMTGTMFNWAGPGSLPEQEMLDIDGDSIYSLTMQVAAGEQQYKYFKNSSWDFGEWNGGDNRVITISSDSTINNTWGSFVSVENIIENVSVYPNPSKGNFKIEVKGTYNMQIIDLTGKVIISKQFTNSDNVTINTAGMYFLKLSDGTNVSVQRLIVK